MSQMFKEAGVCHRHWHNITGSIQSTNPYQFFFFPWDTSSGAACTLHSYPGIRRDKEKKGDSSSLTKRQPLISERDLY